MKYYNILSVITLIIPLFFSCKEEGELIEENGYGTIIISSTIAADAGILLVDVDGEIRDTLKAPGKYLNIKAHTGSRNVKIYAPEKSTMPVVDTVFDVTAIASSLKILYTGDITIVGGGSDGSVKPAPGSSLVQFINLEKSLPASVDMVIQDYYYDEPNKIYLLEPVATIKNITKKTFSEFIELSPSPHGDFSAGYYFDLFDSKTGEKVVDLLISYPFIHFADDGGFAPFVPNKIVSLGIAPEIYNPGGYMTLVIYESTVQ
jgi:hypothetical protein